MATIWWPFIFKVRMLIMVNVDELHLEAHLDCSENLTLNEFNDLLHQIEKVLLEKFGINHVNIQPEFKKPDSKDYIVQD